MSLMKNLNIEETIAGGLFEGKEYPWEVIPSIGDYVVELMSSLGEEYEEIKPNVWVGKGTKVAECVLIEGPTIIGKNCEIRHGAYIRGKVIVGDGCVIGNSSELKNSIVFNGAQVPHFNYVGDSVLGYKAHIGAGVKLSNLKSDKSLIRIVIDGEQVETGLKKMGAIIGDFVEVGCNAVLNPGTVIGKESSIYPLTNVRGFVPANCIVKNDGSVVVKRK